MVDQRAESHLFAEVAALEPALVPKPWGREEWFSGVEARGESRVRAAEGSAPLSEYMAARGRDAPIVLLKLLRPTCGDLYMEVHQTKHEVYVVDAVDPARWPADGAMLLGVDQAARSALGDEAFRDLLRQRAEAAQAGRTGVEEVAALLGSTRLRPGDVVVIPPGAPHSLLRGVTVVEFQTPVFERRILASTGPVVTQAGWDVVEAVAAVELNAPAVVSRHCGTAVVAETPGFAVVRLAEGACRAVPPWSVGWVAAGEVLVGEQRFAAREAFVTAAAASVRGVAGAVAFMAVEI